MSDRYGKRHPDVMFTVGGEGTPSEPAVITFTVLSAIRSNWRQNVPSSVTLEEDGPGHYIMKGRNPSASRTYLIDVFYAIFPPQVGWWCKGQDA